MVGPIPFALLVCGPAEAGPWARPAGSVYGKLGLGHFEGRADFDAVDEFVANAAEAYGEVGLGGGVELDGSARWVVHEALGLTNAGLQDLELVAAWSPISSREALALVAGARVAAYRRGQEPELGPGGADLLFGAGYGRSLGAGWFATDVILRHRLGSPSAGLGLRSELGVLGDAPVGAAVTAEVQPAFGRSGLQPEGAAAPVPRVLGLGAKVFLRVGAGLGATGDAAWLPDLVNDGPGWRVGFGATWES